EDLGVLEVGGALDARGAAEREPRALDAPAQGAAQAVLHERLQHLAHAVDAGLAVGGEMNVVVQKIENQKPPARELASPLVRGANRQKQQIGEREAAPWGAQDG